MDFFKNYVDPHEMNNRRCATKVSRLRSKIRLGEMGKLGFKACRLTPKILLFSEWRVALCFCFSSRSYCRHRF